MKNTDEALVWFKNINDKENSLLMICDIIDFYPSITEKLFKKTIEFAEQHTVITELQKNILLNARSSILHFDNCTWTKNTGLFDVTMGAYDGAQISDLVGLFILNKIKTEIPEINFALYRDDGIAHHKKMRGQQIDKIRKKLHKVFNELGLKITVETALTKADFLDITLNIHENTFEPFRKPNNTPLYINSQSNHPPHVKKNIPIAVNKRLESISSSKQLFEKHKNEYQLALSESGYKHKLQYENKKTQSNNNNNKKHNLSSNVKRQACCSQKEIQIKNKNDNPPTATTPSAAHKKPCAPLFQRITSSAPAIFVPPTSPTNAVHNKTCAPNPTPLPRRSLRIKSRSENKLPPEINATQTENNEPDDKMNNSDHTNKSQQQKQKKKNRMRNVTFFNPPYHSGLKTNIGKQFLDLIDKHFPANNDLSIALNRHTIKLSYATTQNIEQIIAAHNKKILNPQKENEALECNCRLKCPIPGKCRITTVVYKAEINNAIYVGMTQTEVRSRIRRHRHSFKSEYKQHETTLSNYIWSKRLNRNDDGEITEPEIEWDILKKCNLYKPGQKNCDLCLSEKMYIILNQKSPKCINKKSDISNKCSHTKAYFYSEIKDKSELNNNVDVII